MAHPTSDHDEGTVDSDEESVFETPDDNEEEKEAKDEGTAEEEAEDAEDEEEEEEDDDGEEEEDPPRKPALEAKTKLRQTLDTLHREMDVATYSKTSNGQYRRVVPKALSKQKTKKRRTLEREDYEIAEPEMEAYSKRKKRLRGSQLSMEDDVVQASLPLAAATAEIIEAHTNKLEDVEDGEDEQDEEGENGEEGGEEDEKEGGRGDDEEEEPDGDETAEEPTNGARTTRPTTKNGSGSKRGPYKKKHKRQRAPPSVSRRRLFRLKNFRSYKMAQRHGDALGAHARGMPRLAIAQLRAIAKDAPSAPQVYSSLGMVYGDMYQNAWQKWTEQPPFIPSSEPLLETLALAKKSYGSYHIAAILCKKDFTLWLRASDTACDIAALYGLLAVEQRNDADQQQESRKEQEHWYKEAKNDLQTADNLKPPGLDVPIKLVSLHMELGQFSEALTLWTDLLQRQAQTQAFRHNAWLLYAEAMLQIGYECEKWNSGDQSNSNYMFRRWLRKFSNNFDWKERRLQALVLALETAAGSHSCRDVMQWIRRRQKDLQRHREIQQAKEKAAVAFAEALVDIEHDDVLEETKEEIENSETLTEGQPVGQKAEHADAFMADNMDDDQPASFSSPDNADNTQSGSPRWDEAKEVDEGGAALDEPAGDGTASLAKLGSTEPGKGNPENVGDGSANGEKGEQNGMLPNSRKGYDKPINGKPTAENDKVNVENEKSEKDLQPSESKDAYPSESNHHQDETEHGEETETELENYETAHEEESEAEHDDGETEVQHGKEDDEHDDDDRAEGEEDFLKEKRLLLKQNEAEVVAFDQATANMLRVLAKDTSAEGRKNKSKAADERRNARKKLLRYHKTQANKLATEYRKTGAESQNKQDNQENDLDVNAEDKQDFEMVSSDKRQHPIGASCRVVCNIASELMKHMLRMKLYTGGKAVGEAVSLYMKERARVHDKKMEERRKSEILSDPFGRLFSGPGPGFDETPEADSSDDEAEAAYLSDEDQLEGENEDGDILLDSLRCGVLPPEISVLYAISLIHVGGRNYIAKKCMESINQLEQECKAWLTEAPRNTSLATSGEWHFCKAKATEPLGRTAAFAFLAETLAKTPKEEEWANYLAPLFRSHVLNLEKNGLTGALVDPNVGETASSKFRIQQILSSVAAWSRLQLISAKSMYREALRSGEPEDGLRAKESVVDVFKMIKRLLHVSSAQSLLVETDGSISEDCMELLKTFASGYSMLMRSDDCPLDKSKLEELANECNEVIYWFCVKSSNVSDSGGQSSTIFDSTAWDALPLPSSWQSENHKAISLRCYNLCVAFNVSHFSGWEPHEFSLQLMKTRARCTYFGLRINEGKVAGFLPPFVEDELTRQWEALGDFLPAASAFKFNMKLLETKHSQWYQSGRDKHREAMEEEPIATNAEAQALEILLAHSKACLDLSRKKEGAERYDLLMMSLSILLPITQFLLDIQIWDSGIGKAAAFDDVILEGWRQVTRKRRVNRAINKTKRERRRKPKEPARPLDEWFPGEDRSNPLSNAVTLPVKELQKAWGVQTDFSRKVPTVYASRAMRKVHDSMEKLRACYTDTAVEKASLQVACALLDLASVQHTSENPFLVLQQAAIFASHGTKRGSSDFLFREPLPEMKKCSPHDALMILGRADCFQSVYFPYEAAFLCAYVARVVNMHRESRKVKGYDNGMNSDDEPEEASKEKDNTAAEHLGGWNSQWMVVGIMCYNVSIMIRGTAVGKVGGIKLKEDYDPWDKDVIDELLLARADAVAWMYRLSKGEAFSHKNCCKKAPSDYGAFRGEGGGVVATASKDKRESGTFAGDFVIVDTETDNGEPPPLEAGNPSSSNLVQPTTQIVEV